MPRKRRRKETPQQKARTRRRHLLTLFAIVMAVYLSALGGSFVWSDREDVLQGQHRITTWSDIPAALTLPRERYRARLDGGAPDLNHGSWQPSVIFSNSLSWTLWGDCALCWHLENILWHLLTVFGLYVLGRHLLTEHRYANGMAFWAAALFAAHPAAVASVAWIGGRPELLSGAFGIASLAIFSRLQATTNMPRKHHRRWLIGLTLSAIVAMGASEVAYLLPVAALLIAGMSAKQRGRSAVRGIAPMRWQGIGLLFAVLAAFLIWRYLFVGGMHFSGPYPSESFINNLGSGLRHLWYFIEQATLPAEPVISDVWKISNGWGAGEVAALLGTLLLVGAVLFGLRLGHPSAFGGAWFLLWLLPGIGLIPSDRYHNEQSLYLAIWGMVLALVFATTLAWRPIGRQLVRGSETIIFAPVLVVFVVISGFSNARWWSHERLFESEIASDPLYMEGRVQLAKLALEQNKPVDALNHLLTAIESHSKKKFTGYWDGATTYRLLGETQLRMALYDDAVGSLKRSLELRPASARTWQLLGQTYLEMGQYVEAEQSLRMAQQSAPQRVSIRADLGVALIMQRKIKQGRVYLEAALMNPKSSNYLRQSAMGISLLEERKYAAAEKHLRAALSFRERSNTRAALAYDLWKQGREQEALENLSIALQTEDDGAAYVNWVNQQMQSEPSVLPGGSSVLIGQ